MTELSQEIEQLFKPSPAPPNYSALSTAEQHAIFAREALKVQLREGVKAAIEKAEKTAHMEVGSQRPDVPQDDEAPRAPPIALSTAHDFCEAYVPIAYAIEPIVRSSSLYTLTAKTGAGKTALLIKKALAVATGRGELIGRTVKHGRVAYISAENPDDFRMRLMVTAWTFNIDLAELGEKLLILDRRAPPAALIEVMTKAAETAPFTLVIIDTLAAFFTGDDLNDNVKAGEFMRALRPLTQIKGRPSVIVAAHPRKNASDDDLIPYGAGAILNEVDGNLTLKKGAGSTELHWQGKLRGVEFEPVHFRFDLLAAPCVVDEKGREVQIPVLNPTTAADVEEAEAAVENRNVTVLRALADNPKAPIRALEQTTGLKKGAIERALTALEREKLTQRTLGKWALTTAGEKALQA